MEKIDKAIEILQAFKEGKKILVDYCTSERVLTTIEDVLIELGRNNSVRTMKQPTYRPYANAEEFLKASKEHGPYLQRMRDALFRLPEIISDKGIDFYDTYDSYKELLEYGNWADGTPCGILE